MNKVSNNKMEDFGLLGRRFIDQEEDLEDFGPLERRIGRRNRRLR